MWALGVWGQGGRVARVAELRAGAWARVSESGEQESRKRARGPSAELTCRFLARRSRSSRPPPPSARGGARRRRRAAGTHTGTAGRRVQGALAGLHQGRPARAWTAKEAWAGSRHGSHQSARLCPSPATAHEAAPCTPRPLLRAQSQARPPAHSLIECPEPPRSLRGTYHLPLDNVEEEVGVRLRHSRCPRRRDWLRPFTWSGYEAEASRGGNPLGAPGDTRNVTMASTMPPAKSGWGRTCLPPICSPSSHRPVAPPLSAWPWGLLAITQVWPGLQ